MSTLDSWPLAVPGRLVLPSGRVVVGRARHDRAPQIRPLPEFELVLAGSRDRERPARPYIDIRWPDFGLPGDRPSALLAFREALDRSATQRVAVSCRGGRGRTGTALACIAVLDGVDPRDAVRFVRANYDARAVETPWQARFVRTFRGDAPDVQPVGIGV